MISKLKNMTALLFGLIVGSGILSMDSLALSCDPHPDVKQSFQRSDAVFLGKVISVDRTNKYSDFITFEVIRSWGGVSGTQVIITNLLMGGMDIPRLPPQGTEFLVYADVSMSSTRNNPIYITDPCGRGVTNITDLRWFINKGYSRIDDPDKEMEELELLKKEMDERANSDINWIPITSHPEVCTADKARSSRRHWAACWDIVNNGWDGPRMVVIPTGGPTSKPYAIGMNEITRRDWNRYCTLSGNCESIVPFYEPMTDISWGDAEKYVQWLSERTGNVYRLPTVEEWKYAAIAGGKKPSGSANCQTALSGKNAEVRSIAWSDYISGKQISRITNYWGLQDYVGNVQEWVVSNNAKMLAVGGHYNSDEEKCDINYFIEHNGEGDAVTGFRVLMEIQ